MIIVKIEDFIGQYDLPKTIALKPILQSYIDREEKKTLYKLLGQELADLFIADLGATTHLPVTTRFVNLFAPFYLENDGCSPFAYDSHGIKDLLLIQIYSAYLAEEQVIASQSGTVGQSVENGSVTSADNAQRKGDQKWNTNGLDTWTAIRWYCRQKYPDVYPEYKGIQERPRYSSLL